MKQNKVSLDLSKLEEMRKQMGDKYITRVGILGQYSTRSGETEGSMNNATIGLIQIFGSITNNIPPRDFLVMPINHQRREIVKVLGSGAAREAFAQGNYKRVYDILGAAAVGAVDEAFATGGFGTWAANAEITVRGGWMKNKPTGKPFYVKGKGSSAPLINIAELRKSNTWDVVSKSSQALNASTAVSLPVSL